MRYVFFVIFSLFFLKGTSQELDATVQVNYDQVSQSNQKIFKTLEINLKDFLNNTVWINERRTIDRKLSCSFFLLITNYDNDNFTASLQIQAQRLVYMSTYRSVIFNYNDESAAFEYSEFEPFYFDKNTYTSNLVSIMSFYVYTILGLEKDTFSVKGGSELYRRAKNIVDVAQVSKNASWFEKANGKSRWNLVDRLLSNTFQEYRIAMYSYHRNGLDVMYNSTLDAKVSITNSIKMFKSLDKKRPNALLTHVFFDAKVDEIVKIFSDGPKVNTLGLFSLLKNISPNYTQKWNLLKG